MCPTANAIPQFTQPQGRGRVRGTETVLHLTHRYERSTVRQLTDAPGAHPATACGHVRYVEPCPACEGTDARRMAEQLMSTTLARQAWRASRPVVEESMRAA